MMEGPELIEKSISTKLKEWSYEKEHRLIMNKFEGSARKESAVLTDRDRIIRVPDDVIQHVYLGYRMSPEVVHEMKACLSTFQPRPLLFQAIRGDSFVLRFDPVDY